MRKQSEEHKTERFQKEEAQAETDRMVDLERLRKGTVVNGFAEEQEILRLEAEATRKAEAARECRLLEVQAKQQQDEEKKQRDEAEVKNRIE